MRRFTALATLSLLALFAGSCAESTSPTSPGISDAPQPAAASSQSANADGPTFTPFEVAPVVQNREEVARTVQSEYPPVLKDAGVAGRVGVWLYIDRTGRVEDARLARGSGHDAMDQAALRVADVMQFSPATNQAQPVAVWVQVPITFEAG